MNMATDTSTALKKLFAGCQMNPGAREAAIAAAERELRIRLPSAYREFLMFSNGYEGSFGRGSYFQLLPVEDLGKYNKDYDVKTFAPGLILFGTNLGGTAYGFDCRINGKYPVLAMDFIELGFDSASIVKSKGFIDFLKKEHRLINPFLAVPKRRQSKERSPKS